MAISNEVIEANKNEFISLISSITRDSFKKELFLDRMENSDFYYAPASTKYHNNFKGGLVDHCLNVYYRLINLVKLCGLDDKISNESCIIVALMHDLSKRNFYNITIKNKKVYSESGKRDDKDGNGRYDWVSVPGYTVIDSDERFIFGGHEQQAEFMARQFIDLTPDESIAILIHMGPGGYDSNTNLNFAELYRRYPLSMLLHQADMIATCLDETIDR